MAKTIVTLNVEKMPEVVWQLRKEMAGLLCEAADAESDPRVTRRLKDIATAFTVGVYGRDS